MTTRSRCCCSSRSSVASACRCGVSMPRLAPLGRAFTARPAPQALISLKEARIEEAKLREARAREGSPVSPATADLSPHGAARPSPPLRRQSSSMVNVETAGPNTNPLGKLQPEGRREYRPAASTRFGARSQFRSGANRSRCGLLPSGLPTPLVERWHAGSLSGELALREILDAVCRARSGRDATPEERELSSMTQVRPRPLAASHPREPSHAPPPWRWRGERLPDPIDEIDDCAAPLGCAPHRDSSPTAASRWAGSSAGWSAASPSPAASPPASPPISPRCRPC